jgi:excisionase family DNA binding protein
LVSSLTTPSPALSLRPGKAADAIGVSRPTFYRYMQSGEIRTIKVGGCRLVTVAELQRWLDQQASSS